MTKKEVAKCIKKGIKLAQKEEKLPYFDIPQILVEFSDTEEHGDYSTNIALLIGKKTKKSPMEVAKTLAEYLNNICSDNIRVEAIEPGFINFWLSEKELLESLQTILRQKNKYGSAKQNKTLVIDYSAPNIAKPFGVGHLRSTIIGQAIYNIYKFLGWKCIGDNHLGDWGTQFGKLIVAIKKWSQKDLKDLSIEDLEKLYVRFHKEAEKENDLLVKARDSFKKLEQGDKEARKIWKNCVDISLKEYNKIYKMLGVKIDYAFGESFYEDKTQEVIKEAKEKKLAQESQGALVIFLKGVETPLMLLKSDGATTYETRELATIKYRIKKWKPDLIIYEVGADQKLHFQKSFLAAETLGYGKREQFVHIAHGLIRWPHKKFSTREGDTIHLEDILKEAIVRTSEIVEKSQETRGLPRKEKEKIAKEVGIGAIKYNDLSRHYDKDIIFDWNRILSLEGNSGPYLQYVAVRCQSVIEKSEQASKESNRGLKLLLTTKDGLEKLEPEEIMLLRTLRKFPEVVEKSALSFSPNLICRFAFNLAQQYNVFYEKCSILGAETKEKKDLRLALTKATRQMLENSLNLLGISVPEKM